MSMIQTIEECGLNAWPSLQQILYDGWVLRFSNGYTKRANSVNPLYPGSDAPQQKIERCIRLYREQNLTPVFRITPLAHPANLDAMLADLGFYTQSQTSIQTLNLNQMPDAPSTDSFEFQAQFSSEWLTHFHSLKGTHAKNHTHQEILQNIVPKTCFATLSHHNQIVACGLGVREGETVGLFDIITAPTQRRKGFGEKLVYQILGWAKTGGATRAYLQVETDNDPALRLYTKLGFEERYQYWYRIMQD